MFEGPRESMGWEPGGDGRHASKIALSRGRGRTEKGDVERLPSKKAIIDEKTISFGRII